MEKPLLHDCAACGAQISRHSAFCRHCGHPQRLPLIIWLLIIFLILSVAFYLGCVIYGLCNVQDYRVGNVSSLGHVSPFLQDSLGEYTGQMRSGYFL